MSLDRVSTTLLYDVQAHLTALGRIDLVRATIQAVLGWIEALPISFRELSIWQRERSIALLRVGNVRVAQGQVEGALAAYEESLAIRRRLAAVDPQNAGWQRDLPFSCTRLAELDSTVGRLDIALRFAEESLAIDERLAALDPSNGVWKNDVRISRELVARLRSQ